MVNIDLVTDCNTYLYSALSNTREWAGQIRIVLKSYSSDLVR